MVMSVDDDTVRRMTSFATYSSKKRQRQTEGSGFGIKCGELVVRGEYIIHSKHGVMMEGVIYGV